MTINPIAGKGGLVPLIVVTAPTGSTVTCDSVQGTEVAGTWTFHVAIGTHTIVATQGTKTKTETVNVDKVGLFEISISYMPSGCIAEYLFNDNLNDTSGEGNNLTNSGVTFANSGLEALTKCGVFSSAFGTANNTLIPTSSPFSIALWIKTSSASSEKGVLGTASSTSHIGIQMSLYQNNIRFGGYKGTGGSSNFNAQTPITLNQWQFVVATWDGNAGGDVDIYNVTNNTHAHTTANAKMTSNSFNFTVGHYPNDPISYAMSGNIAGLRIYDKVLSSSDIALLYNGGKGI